MAITITSVSVNDRSFASGTPIEVRYGDVGINWDYTTPRRSVIQSNYEFRISTSNLNWGFDGFNGTTFSSPWVRARSRTFTVPSKTLSRGVIYYGQFRLRDSSGSISGWQRFSFQVNRLPFVQNVELTPSEPSETDDLILSYNLPETDASADIRWFRNGVYLNQFDGYSRISRDYVKFNDTWYAQVTPVDQLERGATIASNSVLVQKLPPTVSNVRILPSTPNPNDILEASYAIDDPNTGKRLIDDKSRFNWFVNDTEVVAAQDSRFARLDLNPGDRVFYTITPSDGLFDNESVSSSEVEVVSAGFKVLNVRVDGSANNININSVNPTVEWDVISPKGKVSRFARIRIGTAPGASNVLDEVVETFSEQYTIPDNVVRRGVDYYVSVASSDTNDSFGEAAFANFRIAGSLWDSSVSNATGWTMEVAARVEGPADSSNYQRISIADGSRFAEIRLLTNEVRLLLGSSVVRRAVLDVTSMKNFLITGQGDTIKVFAANELILDGTDAFVQETSDRFIDLGTTADSDVIGHFKRIVYTVEGSYDPSIDPTPFSSIEAQQFIRFVGEDVTDITEHQGDVLVSVNSTNPDESGSIYRIVETEQPVLATVENIDEFDLKVNSMSGSPDGKTTFVNHSKGSSYFENFFLNTFDQFSVFTAGIDPVSDKWELTQTTPFIASSFTSEGLVIDTTFANQSRTDDRLLFTPQENVGALAIEYTFPFITITYEIEITDNNLIIYHPFDNITLTDNFSISLINKTIDDLIEELSRTDIDYQTEGIYRSFFGFIFDLTALNGTGGQPATNLSLFSGGGFISAGTPLWPANDQYNGFTVLTGDFLAIDPYDPNPYSKTAGGKWFYSHRKPGTGWFDSVSNSKGWTVDFDVRIENIEDSDRPSDIDEPEGCGLYLNDGTYYENIYFLPQEIIVKSTGKSYPVDATTRNQYRITGQGEGLQIYVKTPTDRDFRVLAESVLTETASNEGDSSRPRVYYESGKTYVVWHDSGNANRRQVYFAEYTTEAGWSDPEAIVSEVFDAAHPDIAVDTLGNAYVVFESSRSDYTDIYAVQRSGSEWSQPFAISSNIGNSLRPRVATDNRNNVHVVWEDYRLGEPEIFYAFRDGATGNWDSGAFGTGDTQLTNGQAGSRRPALFVAGNTPYIAWTERLSNGNTIVKSGYHQGPGYPYTLQQLDALERRVANGTSVVFGGTPRIGWNTGHQGSSSTQVSLPGARADHVDIHSDPKGNIHYVWQQLVEGVWQIFGRRTSGRINLANAVVQVTTGNQDAKFPSLASDPTDNFLYCAFERSFNNPFDPYDPYVESFDDPNFGQISSKVFISRYDSSFRKWESSNSLIGTSRGGFDVEIFESDKRQSRRPVIAPDSLGNMHILYETEFAAAYNQSLSNARQFTSIRDAVFDKTWEPQYDINPDPYITDQRDLEVSGVEFRKELRFGDFSNNLGAKMIINRIRYNLDGSVGPFNIGLVTSATANIPRVNVLCSAVNNYGDAWLGTDKGLFFFDRRRDEIFAFNQDEFNINGLEIRDIAFDRASNMYLAAEDGVYLSTDHAYFVKLTGDSIPTSANSLDMDSDRTLIVGSDSGLTTIDVRPILAVIRSTQNAAPVAVQTAQTFTIDNGLPSNVINKVRIDANDVAWVGTNQGLVRFFRNSITSFTQKNGLASNKIIDIAIRNTAIRYIATTAGINKMTGISIERLDFGSAVAPPVSLRQEDAADVLIPRFNNARAIIWRDPNILFIATTHDIYQVNFGDEAFGTDAIDISRFRSNDFTLVTVDTERNDDLQTFELVGVDDLEIPDNVLYEIILNGNKITRGYRFSPSKKLLRFEYPLRNSDIVQVNIRFDVEILNRFQQNRAAQVAEGILVTEVNKMLSANGGIYALTGGDINAIQINDETTDLPFDRITLDTQPPVGRIELGEQLTRTTIQTFIRQVQSGDEYLPFDATSGVDSFVVSNFPNFTSDGDTPQPSLPFQTQYTHDLGVIFENVSTQFTFEEGVGRRLMLWQKSGEDPVMVAATSNPAQVYIYSNENQTFERRAILEDGDPNSTVEFLIQFQDRIVIGTGNPTAGQSGKVYLTLNGDDYIVAATISQPFAYCAEILNNKLYIGGGGVEGQLYSYDGQNFETEFTQISSSIFDLVAAEGELYAGTGDQGRVYRLDPKNSTSQILSTDSDPQVVSVGFAEVNGKKLVLTGSGSTALIRRSTLPDGPFISSFRTVNAPVWSMESIDDTLYASIGRTLYALQNVWNSQYTHDEDIRDIVGGAEGEVWFISDSSIQRIADEDIIRRVYLKLIDRAGNETNLFTDDAQTVLDPNLFATITLEDLVGFTNSNRILEVDEFGDTVNTVDGDDRFYSADRVDEEVGVYFSEIFNGTNGLISWDRIDWDATIPTGTSMLVEVRTGDSRDDLLDSEFEISFDGTAQTGDISFINGQYLQFRITMTSEIRDLSPSLRSVIVRSIASESTHFFTTNFLLPSRVKSGILTSTKMIPVAADVIFGFNLNNSVDFAEYQIIDENRVFTSNNEQVGSNLRVGIRLITPSRGETIAEDFGEYGPYNSLLFFNAVEFDYTNTDNESLYHFRISFYEDFARENLAYQAYSANSTAGWSADGELLLSEGVALENGESASISFVPVGDTPIACNSYYYVTVEAVDVDDNFTVLFSDRSFIEACGTTFVDEIDFDFQNETATSKDYQFRIRFYANPERTELLNTAYSGNDSTGWFVGTGGALPSDGLTIPAGGIRDLTYRPDLSIFEPRTTYYLSIDAFDGTEFVNASNSFTFRARDIDTSIYCGEYVDVPVVKNFSVMLELEGNQFITLRGSTPSS
tara:strand:+ start:45152 stop:53575 length:8424 start_codon:yes stop_codon:yes gene_type:complete